MAQTSLKARMLEAFRSRMYFFASLVTVIFLILIIQLINLQLIQGSEYSTRSRHNMENYVPIPSSRGEIFDRKFIDDSRKTIIVSNRPSFNLTTIPDRYENHKQMTKVVTDLCALLKIDAREILKDIKNKNSWEKTVIKEDVGFSKIVKIASHQNLFPHIGWEDAPVRVYNFGNLFSHVVGYTGSINRKEYKRLKKAGYKHYHKIGKSGVEKQYDSLLRGQEGYVRRIVDVRNRTEGEEVGRKPVAGNNIVLSLDFEIQKTVYEALGDRHGAVVVLKPATGEILAMVSKPDFDPNQIVSRNNRQALLDLYKNKGRPFLNRSIQAKYPPASPFKLVTAIAALETEKSYPSKTFYCPGKYTLKGYRDKDFYCYGIHGKLNLQGAIAQSCCVYFYNLGYITGPTSILKYATYFGLDKKTGIDIPGEISGFVPSKKWKLKTFGQPWFDGDTINLSIGQGFMNSTLIGVANLLSGIVNNGIVYRPMVVKEILSPDNSKIIRRFEKQKLREIPLSPTTLNTVKNGMRLGVINGTSRGLKFLKVPVAGKTGTAQTVSKRKDKFSQHAWFAGYAPFNGNPEDTVIVVTLVEYGIAGASSAVPVSRMIFSRLYETGYFK